MEICKTIFLDILISQLYNLYGDYMFKNFSIFFIIFTSVFSFLFTNSSKNNEVDYLKPIDLDYISSYFGYREIYGKSNFHDGIDYPAPENTPVYATKSGIITNASFLTGYGNTVIILHSDGTKSLYGHLSEFFLVHSGQTISQGELIGKVGPKYLSNAKLNGFTTGPHLHFTIFNENGKQINPLSVNLK